MSMPSCSGCWVVAVWLLSTPVFVVIIDSGVTRVWSHPFMGGIRVPLHMGGSTPCQGGRHLLVPPPDMEGYLTITPPRSGHANYDPVLMSGHISLKVHYPTGIYGQ